MKRSALSTVFSLGLLLVHVAPIMSAPPIASYLLPAGGQRGTSVDVSVGGTFDPWPTKVWTNDAGLLIVPGKTKGVLQITIAKDAEPGVHYLRLFNDHGASALRPFVVGTLPEIAEVEPNDHPAKPQVLTSSTVVVNGRLEKDADVDVFAVPLKQGQTLVASLDANRTLKSPMDAVLQVLSPDGYVAMENHDHAGLDPQAVFTAPKDGAYRIRIFAFPAVPNTVIRLASAETYIYRLTLTTSGFADFPLPLAVPRAMPGSVKVEGWNMPKQAKSLLVLAKPENDRAFVSHPDLANAVPVRLETHPTFDAVGNPALAGSPLEPPFVLTGRVEKPGGSLAIRVPVKKGQPLTMQVESPSLGLPLVPLLRVRDESGVVLNRVEPTKPGDDTKLAFRPLTDGTITAEVSDLFGEGGPRFAFLLRVFPAIPDFTLTSPNDRFFIVPGMPLDVKLAIARVGGQKSEVVVKAMDLPAGITMEMLPPVAKPDLTSIMVRFSAEKATSGGSFRLVGTSKDDPSLVRFARANDPELGETTTDLWVAVTENPKPAPVPKKKK